MSVGEITIHLFEELGEADFYRQMRLELHCIIFHSDLLRSTMLVFESMEEHFKLFIELFLMKSPRIKLGHN